MSLLPRRLAPLLLIPAAALVVAGCGGSARPARPAVTGTPLTSMFEAGELLTDPGPTLDILHRLGVQYVRVMVRWRQVAPNASAVSPPPHFDASSPAAYPEANWAPYDAVVRDALARHIGVLFNVTGGAPDWATGPGFTAGGAPGVWRPSAPQFGSFVRAVGTRYSGHYRPPGATSALPRVSFWSIWNEPNLGEADLAPQTTDSSKVEASAAMYRQLLDAGWGGLQQSGHGNDRILIGELAPYGDRAPPSPIFPQGLPGVFGYMEPLRFLRALYCVGSSLRPLQGAAAAARGCPTTSTGSRSFVSQHPALFQAAGFAMHPYPSGGVPPNRVLPVDDPDFVYLATLSRLTGFLDHVTALYGAPVRFPIYATEYGYRTTPPYPGAAPPGLAAAYLNQAEYMSWRDPRLRTSDQYLLVDPPPSSGSKFVTGLEYTNGQPKPSFYAYRLPIYLPVTAQQGRDGLEVWGCVRPANNGPFPQSAKIELQPAGRGEFKTIQAATVRGPSCYFDVRVTFPSAGNVRLAWSYPGGPVIYSRLVAITVS